MGEKFLKTEILLDLTSIKGFKTILRKGLLLKKKIIS